MYARSSTSARRRPEQRLTQRRRQPDRRGTLRWDPNGGERRYSTGRRKGDNWQAMQAALMRLWGETES
jgi:hypothetical protein